MSVPSYLSKDVDRLCEQRKISWRSHKNSFMQAGAVLEKSHHEYLRGIKY
jgi:hypothetical protein